MDAVIGETFIAKPLAESLDCIRHDARVQQPQGVEFGGGERG